MSSHTDSQSDDTRPHRRKSCDLCFRKKIKCDMLLPVCSNCILYKSDCRTSLVRHRAGRQTKQTRASDKTASTELKPNEPTDDLAHRLVRIEDKLQEVLEKTEQRYSTPYELSSDSLGLPALETLKPWVDKYFSTFNGAMPLFQEKVFDKVLFASYNHSTTAWSAILAISAIGIRMTIPGKGLAAASDLPQSANADQYACKALSVAFDLASTSGNILAVQVLVALAMFFTCMGNMEKASALIAMAVNLAHRLQLYSKHSAQYMQKEVAEQRHRVFWVLFSLEKTISYQTTRPSMLAGAEIDIPPPSNHPLDGNGIVWSRDRRSSLNYFRKTLDLSLVLSELSHIHSIASGSEGWATRLSRTRTTLENWYKSIPLEFQLDNVLSNAREEDRMQLTKFYHAYIFALLSMHCFFSPKAKWMLRLSQHGREAAQSYATETIGFRAVRCLSQCEPPSAEVWSLLLDASRGFIKLFGEGLNAIEPSTWCCTNTYNSAVVIVMADTLLSPFDPMANASIVEKATELSQIPPGNSTYSPALQILLGEMCGDLQASERVLQSDISSDSQQGMVSDLDLFDQLEASAMLEGISNPLPDNPFWEEGMLSDDLPFTQF
ncbi:unnamed protein product [Clonostachys rosea f. rosea IK726]|uniref:Zn(2)-C6 fungal-type domain-containing protein n=2 Tax=Bionectria ochroleuca TaxID=29856 RepID=A0A0B7KK93_BIOOC|nr:unnamed protein product [Clonostachys rosea f. rosea IK726]